MFFENEIVENMAIEKLKREIEKLINDSSFKKVELKNRVLNVINFDLDYNIDIVYSVASDYMLVFKNRKTNKTIIVLYAENEDSIMDILKQNIL